MRVWMALSAWERDAWNNALLTMHFPGCWDGYDIWRRGRDFFLFWNQSMRPPGEPWVRVPPDWFYLYEMPVRWFYPDNVVMLVREPPP
jgi:hypothetical protein